MSIQLLTILQALARGACALDGNIDGKRDLAECGLGRALDVIKGKWKPTIIWEVHEKPLRFRELVRRIPGISEKVLFQQLRELEADGVIHRQDFDELPARVEYSLTETGAMLNTSVHALAEWGARHGSAGNL